MRRFEREVVDYKLIEAILQEMTDTHLNVYEQEDDEVPLIFRILSLIEK